MTVALVDSWNESRFVDKMFNVLIQDSNSYYGDEGFYLSKNITGNATIVIPAADLDLGRYYITVDFAGDENTSAYHEEYFTYYNSDLYLDVLESIGTYIIYDYNPNNALNGSINLYLALGEVYNYNYVSDSIEVYVNGELYANVLTATDETDDYGCPYVELKIENLALGENNISIVYRGNDVYSESSESFTVNNYKKDTQINIDLNKPVLIGDNLTIIANITDVDGNLIDREFDLYVYSRQTVYSDEWGEDIRDILLESYAIQSNGTVQFDTSSYSSSLSFVVKGIFNGDSDYEYGYSFVNESSLILSYFLSFDLDYEYQISKDRTNITINPYSHYMSDDEDHFENIYKYEAVDVDVYLNDEFIQTITTTGDDKGYVLELSDLIKGKNSIGFVFNGNDKFNKSSEYIDITLYDVVSKFVYDVNDIPLGQDAVISVKLVDADNGSIIDKQFLIRIADDDYYYSAAFIEEYNVTGNATIIIPAQLLNQGYYYLTMEFEGDKNYSRSYLYDKKFYVGDKEDIKTPTEILITGDNEVDKDSSVISISLLDSNENVPISGTVDIYLNDDLLESIATSDNGFIEYLLEGLVSGENKIKVNFSGNDDYKSSETTFNITCNKIEPVLPDGIFDVEISEDVIVAILSDNEGKAIQDANVLVDVNGEKSNLTTDKGGKISIHIDGNATVKLIYQDENGFMIPYALKIVKETLIEKEEVQVPAPVANATISLVSEDGSSVIATVKDLDGKVIANASLLAVVNGEELNITADENGIATIPISGNSTVKVSFTDSANNATASSELSLTIINTVIEKIVEIIPNRTETLIQYSNMTTKSVVTGVDGRIGELFNASLKDRNGNALVNKTVYIGFNGKIYERTTDENGLVQLQINLKAEGRYTFAVAFLGDDNYTGSFEVALIEVKAQSPVLSTSAKTYKASAKTKSLSASLKSVSANPIPGKLLTFTVNGKSYTAKTNSKGVATVKVSLSKKGTYSFTVRNAKDDAYASVYKSAKLIIK